MSERKPYIVCCGTNGRAVIFGFSETEPVSGESIVLHDARMVLYWAAECGGLFGLAVSGPKGVSRITQAIPVTETGTVQQWLAVTDVAADEIAKWAVA